MADSEAPAWTTLKLLQWTTDYFRRHHIDTPRLDAEVLLAHVLECRRLELYTNFEEAIDEEPRAKYRDLVTRRAKGCPAAYLIGEKEFWSLPFYVTSAVLIPRPETEFLVGAARDFAKRQTVTRILDLATGSACVAISIAREIPASTVLATDLSAEALAVARRNVDRHQLAERVTLLESDLFDQVPADPPFDLIVANPPYIPAQQLEDLPVDVRDYEPRLALDGGADGLAVIDRLIEAAPAYLRPGGGLCLEIDVSHEPQVRARLAVGGAFVVEATLKDAAGLPRIVRARRPGGPPDRPLPLPSFAASEVGEADEGGEARATAAPAAGD